MPDKLQNLENEDLNLVLRSYGVPRCLECKWTTEEPDGLYCDVIQALTKPGGFCCYGSPKNYIDLKGLSEKTFFQDHKQMEAELLFSYRKINQLIELATEMFEDLSRPDMSKNERQEALVEYTKRLKVFNPDL